MAIYPAAVQRPIETQYIGHIPMDSYDRENKHITAGLGSPWGHFNGPGKASSHFCILQGGVVEQYQDTAFRAEGDYQGNPTTLSTEHEGRYGPLTPAQVDASARLSAWLHETHGIPLVLASDSFERETSHGISWHRLGINGNFPALPSPLAGRLQRGGGLIYSQATGKTCPTDPVILYDIPKILAIASGTPTIPEPPIPAPPPPPAPPRLNAYGRALLLEDGRLGPLTITEWQMQDGTSADGFINGAYHRGGKWATSQYSPLIAAAQRRHGTPVDGKVSYGRSALVGAMQRRFGTPLDYCISWPVSTLVAALQKALNEGRYR